jgi:hypothetical protein
MGQTLCVALCFPGGFFIFSSCFVRRLPQSPFKLATVDRNRQRRSSRFAPVQRWLRGSSPRRRGCCRRRKRGRDNLLYICYSGAHGFHKLWTPFGISLVHFCPFTGVKEPAGTCKASRQNEGWRSYSSLLTAPAALTVLPATCQTISFGRVGALRASEWHPAQDYLFLQCLRSSGPQRPIGLQERPSIFR